MLAAHWAVNYRGAGSDGDGSGSPDSDRAVDHGQCRLEKRDVPGRLANKVLNLEGVADVHYINVIERPHRRDIHTDDVVTFGNQLEQGLPISPSPMTTTFLFVLKTLPSGRESDFVTSFELRVI